MTPIVAKKLMQRGYTRVRPLAGGIDAWIDAWIAAGYRVEAMSDPILDSV